MQWITRKFFRIFTIRSITWALLFVLSSATLLPVAVADEAADINHIRGTLDILNEYIQTDQMQFYLDWKAAELAALQSIVPEEYQDRVLKSLVGRGLDDTFQWSDTDNIRAYLKQLTASVYGTPGSSLLPGTLLYNSNQSLTQLYAIRNLLSAVSNSLASASSSAGGQDVLAGNPWWATNSAFALTDNGVLSAYPHESPNQPNTFSFPEFMSRWSESLTYPRSENYVPVSTIRLNWASYFGYNRRSDAFSNNRPYTWFDWMADAMRSNWVLQSSAIESSYNDSDYIVNHLDTIAESSYRNEVFSYSNSVASISNNVLITSNVSTNDLLAFADNPINSEPEPETNALPSFELSLGEIEGNPFDPFVDDISNLLPSLDDSGSPNMVVIPEMTIGGIHVPIGQADFLGSNSSIVPTVQAICRWAWHLVCVVGLFLIVRAEFNFWSTLGGSASD